MRPASQDERDTAPPAIAKQRPPAGPPRADLVGPGAEPLLAHRILVQGLLDAVQPSRERRLELRDLDLVPVSEETVEELLLVREQLGLVLLQPDEVPIGLGEQTRRPGSPGSAGTLGPRGRRSSRSRRSTFARSSIERADLPRADILGRSELDGRLGITFSEGNRLVLSGRRPHDLVDRRPEETTIAAFP